MGYCITFLNAYFEMKEPVVHWRLGTSQIRCFQTLLVYFYWSYFSKWHEATYTHAPCWRPRLEGWYRRVMSIMKCSPPVAFIWLGLITSCLCEPWLCWGSGITGILDDAEEGHKQKDQNIPFHLLSSHALLYCLLFCPHLNLTFVN